MKKERWTGKEREEGGRGRGRKKRGEGKRVAEEVGSLSTGAAWEGRLGSLPVNRSGGERALLSTQGGEWGFGWPQDLRRLLHASSPDATVGLAVFKAEAHPILPQSH